MKRPGKIVILLSFIISCASTQSPDIACNEMTTTTCMESLRCTMVLNPLEKKDEIYICRESINECENNYSQSKGTKEMCESKDGCFHTYGCYCPCSGYGETKVKDNSKKHCLCECGFGEPTSCQKKSNNGINSDSLPLADYAYRYALQRKNTET